MVNLELYKIFITVADEKNITKASERLNITQPAVTKHIKNLEYLLNAKLFIRSNHGIVLTKNGEKLYGEIKDKVDFLSKIENNFSINRDINLGIHPSISRITGKSISEFYKKNPNSHINTRDYDNEEMLDKLEKNELDIVFSKKIDTSKKRNIKYIKLGELNDVLVTNKKSKWCNKKITIEELKNETLFMNRKTSETPKNFFKSTNTKPEDYRDIKNITFLTIMQIVKENPAIGLITKEFFENEIKENELVILNHDFKIKKVEFGIYIGKEKFRELNDLIEIFKINY